MIIINIKKIFIFLAILYHTYYYVNDVYNNLPFSKTDEFIMTNRDNIKVINIDEQNTKANIYLDNDKLSTRISYPKTINFVDYMKNITDGNLGEMRIEYTTTNYFTNYLYNSLLTVGLIYVSFFILKIILHRESLMEHETNYFTIIKHSDWKFSDIIGLESVKNDLREFSNYLRNYDIYRKHGCQLPKGLLFAGPPGVGKTLMAKAFAAESGATFVYTTGSNFNEIFVGVGPKRIRELFNYARKNTPCVIFIDEIDAIGVRDKPYNSNDSGGTINALLAELDGMIDTKRIMVIAATNCKHNIDPAILRSGRFDKTIMFDHPTYLERIELFKQYLNKIKLDKSFEKEKENNIELLAKRTAKLTGADIKNICNQGILEYMKGLKISRSYNKNNNIILVETETDTNFNGCALKHLNDAIDNIFIGNKKHNSIMSNIEKQQVAHHEAGHALVSCLIEYGKMPVKVSIIPRGYALGFVQHEELDNKLMFKNELISNICICLGGRVAEKIIFSDITSGASDDLNKAFELAKKYYIDYGFGKSLIITNEKTYDERYKSQVNSQIEKLVNKCSEFTEMILSDIDNKQLLVTIANSLLESETLNSDELAKIIPQHKLYTEKISKFFENL